MKLKLIYPKGKGFATAPLAYNKADNSVKIDFLTGAGQAGKIRVTAVYSLDDGSIFANSLLSMADLERYIETNTFASKSGKGAVKLLGNKWGFERAVLGGAEGAYITQKLQLADDIDSEKLYIVVTAVRDRLPTAATSITEAFKDIESWDYCIFYADINRKHRVVSLKKSKTLRGYDDGMGELCVATNYKITNGSVLLVKNRDQKGKSVYSSLAYGDVEANPVLSMVAAFKDRSLKDYPYRYCWRVAWADGAENSSSAMELCKYGISAIKLNSDIFIQEDDQ